MEASLKQQGLFAGRALALSALVVLAVCAVWEFGTFEFGMAHGDPQASRLLWIAAIVGVSALIASVAGFAFSAIAGCALAFLDIDPVGAVHTMVMCSIAIQSYGVWKVRAFVRWRSLWPMLAAGAATVPLGVSTLLVADRAVFAAGLGAFLAAYGCYAIARREGRIASGSAWGDAIAGAIGGFTGGLAGSPGWSVTIWCSMRGLDKRAQRAIYQPYILVMQLVAIACLYGYAGKPLDLTYELQFIPFALLGAVGGVALFQRMTNRQFHAAVSGMLAFSGVVLLMRSLVWV